MRQAPPLRDSQEIRVLDAWVRRDLARRYDDALNEPLPSEIVCLLEKLR